LITSTFQSYERNQFQELKVENYSRQLMPRIKKYLLKQDWGVDESVLDERIENLDIRIMDESMVELSEHFGEYDDSTHTVWISNTIRHEDILPTLTHEILHALSGKSETKVQYFDEETTIDYEQKRSGFSMETSKNEEGFLDWFNEAITESLTHSIIGWSVYPQAEAYVLEQNLLDELIETWGLPKDKMHAAYFENYQIKERGQHRQQKMKDFFQSCNKEMGKGFLVGLQKIIDYYTKVFKNRDQALEKTLSLMKEQKEKFKKAIKEGPEVLKVKRRNKVKKK